MVQRILIVALVLLVLGNQITILEALFAELIFVLGVVFATSREFDFWSSFRKSPEQIAQEDRERVRRITARESASPTDPDSAEEAGR